MCSTRPSGGWATADDWAAHRPIIAQLYRDQNKTLASTMAIMRDNHNFHATTRMYKARLQQWGIEKKIKAEDAVEIFRQVTARARAGKSSVAYVRGRRINPERLQRYRYRAPAVVSEQILRVERQSASSPQSSDSSPEPPPAALSHVVCRTPSPVCCSSPDARQQAQAPTPSISPRLEDPAELGVPQDCMRILGNYIAGSFEAGAWQQRDPGRAEVNDAFTWAHYLATSQGLVAHGRTREGFFLLGICFDKYKAHLQRPDSFFWLATYKAAMLLAHRDQKLGESFINYASRLTALVLPAQHPFNHVWSRIMRTGMAGLQQHAAALFESYLDTWRRHVTDVHADPESVVQMAFVFIQLHCSGMITFAFLRDIVTGMMGLLLPAASAAATQYLLREAQFRMACLLVEKRKYGRAGGEIDDIVAWLDAQPNGDDDHHRRYVHLRVKCLWVAFEILDRRGARIEEALQAGLDLVRLCQGVYGPMHLQTLDALAAVEGFLLRQTSGKTTLLPAVTRSLTRDFEGRWQAFDRRARARRDFPHVIEKPWFHRCVELGEDQRYIQETIDLFDQCSWLK
ncbi:hypothetical protein GGR56DRAFT_401963 [Xylariaceae sp. FL0804]|nr:hypothetical protein GGR56DRAFT_401963 [Xylariaceae sp. FL0804]